MADLDLDKDDPGKLYVAAENAKDYQLLLVADRPIFSARAFERNPNTATGADLFFKAPMVQDDGGKASLDLSPHAKTIKDKLKEKSTKARAVVISSARPGNEDPQARLASVQNILLHKKAASIKLKPLKGSVSQQDWIAHHHVILFVEMEVKEVPQVSFEVDPKTAWGQSPIMVGGFWENTAPGEIGVKRMLMGGIGDNHGPNPKCQFPGNLHANWWPLWDKQIKANFAPITLSLEPATGTYVFGLYPRHPGQFVLTVRGTGPNKDLVEKANVSFNGPHSNPGD